MRTALLLIDVQSDFLKRRDLSPHPTALVEQVERLLTECRGLGVPVMHVHTVIRPDGSDRMPHWQREGTWDCVAGTPGAFPPEVLQPRDKEPVFGKQFYSAFGNPALAEALAGDETDSLILAGLYLHGCIRSTVLDAYERGFEVWVAEEAVGSTQPDHAELTRDYLNGRSAVFLDTRTILARLGKLPRTTTATTGGIPTARVSGSWVASPTSNSTKRRNPSKWSEVLECVPFAGLAEVESAVAAASRGQAEWSRVASGERANLLRRWAQMLANRETELVQLMAREIGKPVRDGRKEVQLAESLAESAARQTGVFESLHLPPDGAVEVRFSPHGVVGLITPWNNPVAIPVGKIAPALAAGNGVVWKPAFEAPRTAMAVMESLDQVGAPAGLVNLVFGAETTARQIIDATGVAAVSLTGSVAVGKAAAARCTFRGKPLQAELGGNNAAIVLDDCDLTAAANELAQAAFSFSGQRCTAIQRILVSRDSLQSFCRQFVSAVELLRLGDPRDEATEIGPLVSQAHQRWVLSQIADAVSDGARILCGGAIPSRWQAGCWIAPTVISDVRPESPVTQTEVFGPVAMVLPIDDLEHGLRVANNVRYGLVASLFTRDIETQRRFCSAVEAGILKVAPGPLQIHPAAPFGGWKSSAFGPPEHGIWDREFYTRPKAIYGPLID